MKTKRILFAALVLLGPMSATGSGSAGFEAGPLISTFGQVAAVDSDIAVPRDTVLRVSFDVASAADTGKVNRHVESAARFLNMHAAVGVPPENIELAVVVHGAASRDLLADGAYRAQSGVDNPNVDLLRALLKHDVRIILCGQTAAYRGIEKEDLLPGVEVALSAMTAHAMLQQDGFSLNPF